MKKRNIMPEFKISLRAFSAILSVILLVASLPMGVFANDLIELLNSMENIQEQDNIDTLTADSENYDLLREAFEVKELRTKDTKNPTEIGEGIGQKIGEWFKGVFK